MWRFGRRNHLKHKPHRHGSGFPNTLADVRPGEGAKLLGFAPDLPPERWAHLQAYGLVPGRLVRVLQHAPVTVVQVEHCEIALENELACQIRVARPAN
jgi:Fe2+ transport system protein FeoA